MDSPLPEFHPPGDARIDISGPLDAQYINENDVFKYKGYLGVPIPFKDPPVITLPERL